MYKYKLYFTNDKPEIPDSEYDQIKKEVLELTKKFKFLDELAMKANLVGAPLSNKFKKIKHLIPMLSLSNALLLTKKTIVSFGWNQLEHPARYP